MKKISKISYIFLLIILSLAVFSGYSSYKYAKLYETNEKEIATLLGVDNLTKMKLESALESMTFGYIKSDLKEKLKVLKSSSGRYKNSAMRYFYIYLALVVLLLIFRGKMLFFGLAFASMTSLVIGLIAPILMITIHKNVDYLGDVVLSFDSKSILQSVIKLYDEKEVVVAGIIFIFSVFIPFMKSVFLIIVAISDKFDIKNFIFNFFKYLGKYSMIDIFVISILIVYIGSGDFTRGSLGVGFYFFLVYLFLSIFLYFKVEKEMSLS